VAFIYRKNSQKIKIVRVLMVLLSWRGAIVVHMKLPCGVAHGIERRVHVSRSDLANRESWRSTWNYV